MVRPYAIACKQNGWKENGHAKYHTNSGKQNDHAISCIQLETLNGHAKQLETKLSCKQSETHIGIYRVIQKKLDTTLEIYFWD